LLVALPNGNKQVLLHQQRPQEALQLLREAIAGCLGAEPHGASQGPEGSGATSCGGPERALWRVLAAAIGQLGCAASQLIAAAASAAAEGEAQAGVAAEAAAARQSALFPTPLYWTAQLASLAESQVRRGRKGTRAGKFLHNHPFQLPCWRSIAAGAMSIPRRHPLLQGQPADEQPTQWRAGHLMRLSVGPLIAAFAAAADARDRAPLDSPAREAAALGGLGPRAAGLALVSAALSRPPCRPQALLQALAPQVTALLSLAGGPADDGGEDGGDGTGGWLRGAVLACEAEVAARSLGLGANVVGAFAQQSWWVGRPLQSAPPAAVGR
jgi:hypothetical protein